MNPKLTPDSLPPRRGDCQIVNSTAYMMQLAFSPKNHGLCSSLIRMPVREIAILELNPMPYPPTCHLLSAWKAAYTLRAGVGHRETALSTFPRRPWPPGTVNFPRAHFRVRFLGIPSSLQVLVNPLWVFASLRGFLFFSFEVRRSPLADFIRAGRM